jgi:hypothetical protein
MNNTAARLPIESTPLSLVDEVQQLIIVIVSLPEEQRLPDSAKLRFLYASTNLEGICHLFDNRQTEFELWLGYDLIDGESTKVIRTLMEYGQAGQAFPISRITLVTERYTAAEHVAKLLYQAGYARIEVPQRPAEIVVQSYSTEYDDEEDIDPVTDEQLAS